jgi:deoxycytidylate deaminase
MADVFINVADPASFEASIERFIRLLFGYPYDTPTREEYAMFHAQAAALRSASLGRQVGAVVATIDGDIVSHGSNDVAKAGGGLYWTGDPQDRRDFRLGEDSNDKMKRMLLADVFDRLANAEWFLEAIRNQGTLALVDRALTEGFDPIMKGAQITSIIEFGRAVHAEMAALMDAAR